MLVVGRVPFIIERMAEYLPCKDEAASVAVAVAILGVISSVRREVNATTIGAALFQALVEPLLHDLGDAVLVRSLEQQNPVFARVKVHFEVARRM